MDRQEQIEILLDHYHNPRFRGQLDEPDVTMPGGNPGCGDIITIYLNGVEAGQPVTEVTWEGEGCTISQASASILFELLYEEGWTFEDILNLDYEVMIDILGKEAVQTRPKCATLALGTLKAAVRKYQRDRIREQLGLAPDAPLPDTVDEAAELGLVVGDAALEERGRALPH